MVSEKEVEKIASLSRLKLTDAEKQAFATQLSNVLNHFQQLSSVVTDGVEPLVTPTDVVDQWRKDEVKVWKDAETAVREAPEKVGNLFKVPPVVGV
jgi:aspartyl-tRNA(Asn)/glutamyl-tRNA(Gln) amidotransferase subunit C